MNWKIALADDHQLVIDGLTNIIATSGQFELVGAFNNGKGLLDWIAESPTKPDVILTDIDMPGLNGLDLAKNLRRHHPEVKVLLLTMHDESIYYNKAVAAQVDGIVSKSIGQSELLRTLVDICLGVYIFSNGMKSRRVGVDSEHLSEIELTEREVEVLKKIAVGMSNAEISDSLGISIRTVDTHRTNLKKKLSVTGIAGLVRYAFQQGLVA